MKILRQIVISVLLSSLLLSSCHSKQDGAIEGAMHPSGRSAQIKAIRDGKDIQTISAGMQNGKFKFVLAACVYTIKVSTADSPFSLHMNNIMVKSGETTELPPIELTAPSGSGGLSGKIIPPRPDIELKLIYEGRERAAVHADREGKYEFKEIPAGAYVVQANAPGHADDAIPVLITDNQKTEQNAVLLPIVAIAGVDWASGKFLATGYGMPPQNASNGTVRREMTKRAALADAQRNMLNTIVRIRMDANQTVKTAMRNKNVALKIEGFLKGFTIVSEIEREDGKFEVVLELPLTGPAGLTRYITE
jgi:hypothetical protein